MIYSYRDVVDAYAHMLAYKDYKTKPLEDALKKSTGYDIAVRMIDVHPSQMFVMCITPDRGTIQQLTGLLTGAVSRMDLVRETWHRCKKWNLDVDMTLFEFLSADELAAVTLHEIGHMLAGDSVTNRLCETVQVMLVDSPLAHGLLLKDQISRRVASLPIVAACHFNCDKKSIQKELKADRTAAESGFREPLISAIGKIEDAYGNRIEDPNADINASREQMREILDALEKRKTALAKWKLTDIMKHSPAGSAVFECAESTIDGLWLGDGNENMPWLKKHIDRTFLEGANDLFGQLEPITRQQIDYIGVKVGAIKTMDDQLLMVSYINSKLDIIDYYMSILEYGKKGKKRKVPHSMEYLKSTKRELERLKEEAMNKKISDQISRVIVGYPDGYEG